MTCTACGLEEVMQEHVLVCLKLINNNNKGYKNVKQAQLGVSHSFHSKNTIENFHFSPEEIIDMLIQWLNGDMFEYVLYIGCNPS